MRTSFAQALKRMSSPVILFGAFTLCLLAAQIGVIRALVALAWVDPTASHVVGIPLVSLALIYASRESIFSSVKPAGLIGGSVIAAGLALSVGGRLFSEGLEDALSVAVAGLALSWIGGFLLFFGVAAARAALFPLAFLAFMIPIPSALIDGATSFLKAGSAEAVASLFTLTGTPYFQQGFVFSLPTFMIEIADECSGIRSSIALLLTSLLVSHRVLSSPWTKALVVLVVLPIAVLKNGIRIVSLSLLATHVDPSFLTGQLHHEGGILFFLLSLGLMVPVFMFLRWSERPASEPPHLS
jgi:exosortase